MFLWVHCDIYISVLWGFWKSISSFNVKIDGPFIYAVTKVDILHQAPQSNQSQAKSDRKDQRRTAMQRIFGTEMTIATNFRNGHQEKKKKVPLMFTLSYPPLGSPDEAPVPVSFCDVVCRSICSVVQAKSWDLSSSTYQPMEQIRTPTSLPEVLALNCGLFREEEKQFWKVRFFLVRVGKSRRNNLIYQIYCCFE